MRKTITYLLAATLQLITICLTSCQKQDSLKKTVSVSISTIGIASKSNDPTDEEAVSDINLFVFNNISGRLETQVYLDKRNYHGGGVSMDLLSGIRYEAVAALNLGYKIQGIRVIEDLTRYRYYMAYPDEYKAGIPMATEKVSFVAGQQAGTIILHAERLMAKISLSIDRSGLDRDIRITAAEAEIGGCPKSVTPFSESRPLGKSDIFAKGFNKTGTQIRNLNSTNVDGKSKEVSMYMLESIGGMLPGMDNPSAAATYPYIQVKMDYMKADGTPLSGYLTYRFCIGDHVGSANIRRNNEYHFTICPQGDGLSGEPSWKVEITK